MKSISKILVPVAFTPASDAALEFALALAYACGAEVEIMHVWKTDGGIFADTPAGAAMERTLTAAEMLHPARVSGRLEFQKGEGDPSSVILSVLEREPFDLVVIGREGAGRIATNIETSAPCRVVTRAA